MMQFAERVGDRRQDCTPDGPRCHKGWICCKKGREREFVWKSGVRPCVELAQKSGCASGGAGGLREAHMYVWLCGMPHEYSEDDVRAYWEECGPIESMDLLRFKDSGRFNGAAFITFRTEVRP
eukprot:1158811-Pelagomonas_calceolata.AAC.5